MSSAQAIDNVRKVQGAYRVLATYLQLSAHLFPPQQTIQDKIHVDYIVVGAGSSGCVIANRLTEDPGRTVLLLEAGENPPIESVLPGLAAYLKETPYDWNFTPVKGKSNYLKNDVPQILQGKMLGGSTSINYMSYIRGAPPDYDAIAELLNDDSWKHENLLKYFKRSEHFYGRDELSAEDRSYHGYRGYMGVTKEDNNETYVLLEGFKEAGNELVDDINGATPIGYTQPMSIIANGYRQSTGYAFLSKIDRENLILYRNTMVTKILFDDNKRAIGVEAVNDKTTMRFYARKEVIVAAGTFNTPKLLMLSQIGPKADLEKMNIGCISDLPVGKNLQYTNVVLTVIRMGESKFVQQFKPREFPSPPIVGTVALNGNTSSSYGTLSYIVDSNVFLTYCAFSLGVKNEICDKFYKDAKERAILFSAIGLVSPKSRGTVKLKSNNYKDAPVIDLATYSEVEDLDNMAKYVEHYMKVANTDSFKSINAKVLYLDISDCTAEKGTLEYWRSYSSKMAIPFQNYIGSCSMGSVVDTNFRVYGVKNLRVADASIIPLTTGGIMDTPTIMVGEKVADIIKFSTSIEPIYPDGSDESEDNDDSNISLEKNASGLKISCYTTLTKQEVTQYSQEIMSELHIKVETVITEVKNNLTIGDTYIIKNIDLTEKQVEEIRKIYLSALDEKGTYNTSHIDVFVENVINIFQEKQVTMIREVDGNAADGYTKSDKAAIKCSITYCIESIVQCIQQKKSEIVKRLSDNVSGK